MDHCEIASQLSNTILPQQGFKYLHVLERKMPEYEAGRLFQHPAGRPHPRSLSDINRSTAANDLQPSASFSARKNPQCIPVNTPPIFSRLAPLIWSPLLRLVTKAMSDRLLAGESNASRRRAAVGAHR